MIPAPTPEDLAIRESMRRFAESDLAPQAAGFDESGAFVGAHLPGLAALGAMGLTLPEEWGGVGASALGLVGAVEEMARGCAATASMVTAHYLATDAILLAGSEAQRARYLPPAAAGKMLGAFALTEPGAGSSPADMTTRAVESDGHVHLQGTKHFISNAAKADFIVVFALSGSTGARPIIDAFILDRGMAGLAFGAPEPTMGMRGGHIFEVALDCRIPAECRL